ncbi:MAG: DUF5672 family protein [Lachnospiraceae bacterium]|nr:DUF5672 family protein [Lachnospiraceae bacterium]
MADYKNGKLQLPNVTLAAMASVKVESTVKALEYSCRGVDFGAVTFISHRKPLFLPKHIEYQHIDKIDEINKFNYDMIYEMWKYIHTDYMLLVHYDGFVVNPDSWRDEFLDYDYIGSPFPIPKDDFTYRDPNGKLMRVGNSVSLRSSKLLRFPTESGMPFEADHGFFNEDGFICVKNHRLFEAAGMKFAPFDVAKYFGHESMQPEFEGIKPFVFHKWAGTNSDYPNFLNKHAKVRKLMDRIDLMG